MFAYLFEIPIARKVVQTERFLFYHHIDFYDLIFRMIAAADGIKVKQQMNIVDSIFKNFAESTLYHHHRERSFCVEKL